MRGLELLEVLEPVFKNDITPMTENKIFNNLYTHNLIEPLLNFVDRLKRNFENKSKGIEMCVPFITWETNNQIPHMYCMDNIYMLQCLRLSNIGKYINVINKYYYTIKKSSGLIYYSYKGKIYPPNTMVVDGIGESRLIQDVLNSNIVIVSRFAKICYSCESNDAAIENLEINEIGSSQKLIFIKDSLTRNNYSNTSKLLITCDFIVDPTYHKMEIHTLEIPKNANINNSKLYKIYYDYSVEYEDIHPIDNIIHIPTHEMGYDSKDNLCVKIIHVLDITSPYNDYQIRYIFNIYYNTAYISGKYLKSENSYIKHSLNVTDSIPDRIIRQTFNNKINIAPDTHKFTLGFYHKYIDIKNGNDNDTKIPITKCNLDTIAIKHSDFNELHLVILNLDNHICLSDDIPIDVKPLHLKI